jgi:hypothetical protein
VHKNLVLAFYSAAVDTGVSIEADVPILSSSRINDLRHNDFIIAYVQITIDECTVVCDTKDLSFKVLIYYFEFT